MSEQNRKADSANLSGGSAGAGIVGDLADAEIVDSGDAMSEAIEPKTKPKNLARRERLNPDWPIRIYTYDCWVVTEAPPEVWGTPIAERLRERRERMAGKPPQELWDTAKLMQSLWNELCAEFQKASAADLKDESGKSLLSKEERKAIYAPLDLKPLRAIAQRYAGQLPSDCYYAVVDRFLVTFKEWRESAKVKRKNPKVKGPPRPKFSLDKINIPLVLMAGKPTNWLAENSGHAWVRNTLALKPAPGEAPSAAYWQNGRFNVGINRTPINLHVALHRDLPEVGRIKRVSLVGVREKAFGWSWKLQVQVEHPPLPVLPEVGRVAGLDLGWRVREGGLRLGVLTDQSGNSTELKLPFAFGNANARRRSEWAKAKGLDDHTIADWRDIWEWQRRADAWKDRCKQQLAGIPAEMREVWPEEARRSYGALRKMGVGGLRRLRRLLREAGIEDAAVTALTEWQGTAERYSRWIRGAQLNAVRHRNDHYRKKADWIARNFDVIAWESDLGLKEMAEEDSGQYAIENAKTYRHLASLSTLRLFIAEAMKKNGRKIEPVKSAWTNRCRFCGEYLEPTSKRLVVCGNGHTNDIDEAAAAFLCNQIEGIASTGGEKAEIPAQLSRYLQPLA